MYDENSEWKKGSKKRGQKVLFVETENPGICTNKKKGIKNISSHFLLVVSKAIILSFQCVSIPFLFLILQLTFDMLLFGCDKDFQGFMEF